MSFGFSIGDFITVIQLAKRIREDFVGAPKQFQNISNELRSLSIVLQDTEIVLSGCEIDEKQKKSLNEIATNCNEVLNSLKEKLSKYSKLGTNRQNVKQKVRRVWDQLRWEPEDIREIRAQITSNISLLSTYMANISNATVFAAKTGIDRLNTLQDNNERLAILNWLTPFDYAPQQSDLISRQQAGTGQWFLNAPTYQAWLSSKQSTLFCPGIPGAGKTMLVSIVIDDLTDRFENETVGLAYIYCNFRRADEQRAEDLLASLLKQLAQGQASLPKCVKSLFNKHKARLTRASIKEISEALHLVATMYSKVFIIVDALDECQVSDDCRSKFLDEVFNMQVKCEINFMATSRSIPEISERFNGAQLVTISATAEDVQKYVDGHLSRLPSFVRRRPELKEEIITGIIRAIDGMFQLAKLHLDSLIGKKSPKSLRNALERLPSGSDAYDQAYQNAMERIGGQREDQEKLAKQVLCWITCAMRPLSTRELQHALAVEFGGPELDEDNLTDLEDIVSVCAGLVTIDEESDIIRLVHYTAQEFFKRTQKQWFPNAESEISRICATYLSFAVFESGPCYSDDSVYSDGSIYYDDKFVGRLGSYPFYAYAGNNWGHHAREALTLHPDVIDFLNSHNMSKASSQALAHVRKLQRPIAGLHLAAYFGVTQAVEALLEGVNANSNDDTGRTSPPWAAENGHEAVIGQLLAKDSVDVNSKDYEGRTPLSYASQSGYEAIVKLLLMTEGIQVNVKDDVGMAPLSLAAERGHAAVAELLLAKEGVDANSKDDFGFTPLSWAAQAGRLAIVKLLLSKEGVDANSKTQDGQTPLTVAVLFGRTAVVGLLLANGSVNADAEDSSGRTPLSYAAQFGHIAMVKLLLAKGGVNADSTDNSGQTPLSYAARRGDECGVKLLLSTKGIDADAKDNTGRTPLSRAAEAGNEDVVKLLLSIKGIDADAKDNTGRTPLSRAAEAGNEDVVKLLLSTKGIDADAKDNTGRTPLSWAATNRRKTFAAKLLLANDGVDANSVDYSGRTPLLWAAKAGNKGVMKFLLSIKGIDANAKDNIGWTPLSWAAIYWYDLSAAKLLLANDGVDPNSADCSGRTSLSRVAGLGVMPIVELLLADKRVDVGIEDNTGQTALSWAAAKGHDSIVKLLEARLYE